MSSQPANGALSEEAIFRLTASGSTALAQPQGRVSRGFLRLLGLVDGRRSVAELRTATPNLSAGDVLLWTRELQRQGLIEPVSAAGAGTGSYAYEGFLEMEKDDDFNKTVEHVRQALKREQPQTEDHLLKTTARLVALESTATSRTINESGYFAFPSRAAGPEGNEPSNFLVLIVEDDPLQARITQALVAKDGFRTAVAADGNELLAHLKAEQRPDLILMDVELPVGDGFDFLDQIRKHPHYTKTRVIMLTGRAQRSDIARGIMLGANGYVTKPYKPELLRSAIRQTLNLA
jgi:CheY-like chemotaxis protein